MSEGANIVCEAENTKTASTTQTLPSTLNNQIQISKLNNTITEKKSQKAKLIEKKEIARNASKAVDEINQSLQGLQRLKRQTGDKSKYIDILSLTSFDLRFSTRFWI